MDYSLLLAIEKNKDSNIQEDVESGHSSSSARYLAQSSDGQYTYHMSVIDFLQDWNWNKRMERFAKTKLTIKDPAGLSAIEPTAYQKRFIHFINAVFTGMKFGGFGSTTTTSTNGQNDALNRTQSSDGRLLNDSMNVEDKSTTFPRTHCTDLDKHASSLSVDSQWVFRKCCAATGSIQL